MIRSFVSLFLRSSNTRRMVVSTLCAIGCLVGPLARGQLSAPPPTVSFTIDRQFVYQQSGANTLTFTSALILAQATINVLFSNEPQTLLFEIGGRVYTFRIPPSSVIPASAFPIIHPSVSESTSSVALSGLFLFLERFDSATALNTAFPPGAPIRFFQTWPSGQRVTNVTLASTIGHTAIAPITNFDALQRWDGGTLAITWRPPTSPALGTNLWLRIQTRGGASTSAITRYAREIAIEDGGVEISGLAATPGETLTAELFYGQSGIVFPIPEIVISFPIHRAPLAPAISAQPVARAAAVGSAVTFAVTATSTELTYQWRKNGAAIAGATNASLTLPSVQLSDTGDYSVVVTNMSGSVTSAVARLDVAAAISAPAISAQPLAQTLLNGDRLTLSVAASGTDLAFQWFRDGAAIAGATGATFSVTSVTLADAGRYTVSITNSAGTVTSSGVVVAVNPVSRIANLSILTSLTSAGDNFTMGYVVGGNNTGGPKPLVLRAAGPSLGALGVPGTLDDPKLELFAGSTKTGENDNWGGGAALVSAMSAVGAFPYSAATSRDAAATGSITTRDNSVKVSAAGSGTGTVIAEIYDATPAASFTTTTPRLLNVSVLKNIGTGLTAGFVIGGSAPKTVLIRAIGPTLGAAPFGVPGVVADPQLTLFGAASARLQENDNWGGTTALTAAFTAVGAFPLANDSRDAAILATLPPGSYSVEVKGVASSTGIALVEVYEVP